MGRYRDRYLWIGQAEYRFPIYWRFGGAAFGGVGDVADRVRDARAEDLKWSAGAGIRFLLNEDEGLNLRLDGAVGREGFEIYLDVGEAF